MENALAGTTIGQAQGNKKKRATSKLLSSFFSVSWKNQN